MQTISISPATSQQLNIRLSDQDCTIRLVQRTTGLFIDLSVNGKYLIQSVICLNCNKLVRYAQHSFSGDLFFADTKGSDDPVYDELGGRFKLFYITADELEANI